MHGPDRVLLVRKFRAARRDLAYLRFVLEAYEGLGIQTSNAGSNLVIWQLPPSQTTEADALLAALAREVPLQELPQPDAQST